MESSEMKIAILTSSRADYGIYLPLINELYYKSFCTLELICFGTHLSKFHGYTIDNIDSSKFSRIHKIENVIANDSPNSVSTSYGITSLKFADFWDLNKFDLVFCLGDRYEMAAAVFAGIPYNVKFAHIHGGETTLGAIDNVYRHSITMASKVHFASTKDYCEKIHTLKNGEDDLIFNVGALSLDNLDSIKLLSKENFKEKWGIDLDIKSVLITVHPETVDYELNEQYSFEVFEAFKEIQKTRQLIVTMPNADTSGSIFRKMFLSLKELFPERVILIENFGSQSYFTCMKYVDLLIGNTSSGIIEAATFGKFVLNLGDRQKGRLCSENILQTKFSKEEIIANFSKIKEQEFKGNNIYFQAGASKKIVNYLINNKL